MSDQLSEVMEHLLFQKALIDDAPRQDDRISRYIEIARQVEAGTISAYNDPFDRSVATVFELVSQNQLDPWDIDLGQFARLYLEHIAGGAVVDFVVAGRIIYLAWSVLKMQTGQMVLRYQPPPEATDIGLDDGSLDGGLDAGLAQQPLDVLVPVIRRTPQRPVTLIDLVDAFDEARREIELRQMLQASRVKAVEELPRFNGRVHSEDLEEGITNTWSRILSSREEWIPLGDLHGDGRDDFVTTFIAVLFLAKLGRVDVKQDGPAWKIRVPSMEPGYKRGFLAKRKAQKLVQEVGAGGGESPAAMPAAPDASSIAVGGSGSASPSPMVEADGGSVPVREEKPLGEVFVRNIAGTSDIAEEARQTALAAKEAAKAAEARARTPKKHHARKEKVPEDESKTEEKAEDEVVA